MANVLQQCIYAPVKTFIRQDADYHRDNRERITQKNNRMLRVGCVVYMMVLIVYTAGILITGTSTLLLMMYCSFGVANIVLTAMAFTRSKKSCENARLTQVLCGIFEFLMLLFFAVEGVFPFPNTHSLYIPIALFLVIQFFIHSIRYSFVLCFCYCVSYGVAALLVKAPEIAANDVRIAAATLIAALINCVLLSILRASEGRAMKNLRYLSTIDSLTGVFNRQTVDRMCEAYIAGRNETDGEPYALFLIDLDQFKSINDTCGHLAGDEALRKFGALLKASFYDRDFVGRYGGDEFLAVLSGPSLTVDIVQKKAQTLLNDTGMLMIEATNMKLSCSIGIVFAESCSRAESMEQVLSCADKALYAAKTNGRSQSVLTLIDADACKALAKGGAQ